MKEFSVITKQHCPRCEELKGWFKANNLKIEEWPIESEEVKHKLLNDENFIQTFCDIDGCMVYTPVVYVKAEKKYYFKELFSQVGVREKFIKEKLEL